MDDKQQQLADEAHRIGDLAKMTHEQAMAWHDAICEEMGISRLMRPLYRQRTAEGTYVWEPNSGAAEQLRKRHRVSLKTLESKLLTTTDYMVKVHAWLPDGREEDAMSVVSLTKPKRVQQGRWPDGKAKYVNATDENGDEILIELRGEARANQIMRCETKAKNRVTFAITGCGLSGAESDQSFEPAAHISEPAPMMFTGTAEEATANLFGDDPAPLPSQGPIFLENTPDEIPESEPYSEPLPPEGPNFPESEPGDIPEGEPGGEVQDQELAALFVDELKERMTARNKYSYQAVRGYVLLQYKVEPEQLNHGQRARVLSWTEPERIGWLEGELQKNKGEIARVLREASKRETVAF